MAQDWAEIAGVFRGRLTGYRFWLRTGWRQAGLTLCLVLVAAWLLWPVLDHAVQAWSSDEELRFGFLISPVTLGLIVWRRAAIQRSVGRGSVAGLVVLGLGLLAYLVCERLAARSPAALAAGTVVWGAVVYMWGWRAGRALALPIGLVTFSLTLQQTLIAPLAFELQGITAGGATNVSRLFGLPIMQEGLVLKTGNFAFVVAEACSGMNSLLSLLALAGLWLYLAQGSLLRRSGVLLSVLPLVIIANTTRVVLVLLVASGFGQDAALGFFHGVSSLVLFGLALVGLFAVSRVVGCRIQVAV